MDEVRTHGLFEARRFLVAVQKAMQEEGTLDFDQALLLCFLAGRKNFVLWAMDNPVTIGRDMIAVAVREGFSRLSNGKLSSNWEEEWKPIS